MAFLPKFFFSMSYLSMAKLKKKKKKSFFCFVFFIRILNYVYFSFDKCTYINNVPAYKLVALIKVKIG